MKKTVLALVLLVGTTALAQDVVRIDGSSTVYPVSLAVAEEFQIDNPGDRVTVSFSGTGGGFEKFCNGETDISNASRAIRQIEIDSCEETGVPFIELPVVFDALTIAVNPENDFVECLTVDEVAATFGPNSDIETWSDIRSEWPAEEIAFYIPGTDSGTFDYFTEAINGEVGASRTDVFPSEDDNVLIQGISGDENGLGYFGLAYFIENQDRVNAVAIDNGDGCVEPSIENVENNNYQPLARPLFIYVSADSAEENPTVDSFIEYYLSEDSREFIADTGYVLLSDAVYDAALERFEQRVTGAPFTEFEAGDSVLDTVSEGVE
ncbi:MAG: PstS family phosphate ABC transporter substrate-binding protein [Trueperaceae bacterium]|nr:PstS family phosphate ABC transporter substrate-binding protein [Trueperaceae bacterium]